MWKAVFTIIVTFYSVYTEYGCQFNLSNTVMEEFKNHVNANGILMHGVDLAVSRILTTGFWPIQVSDLHCIPKHAETNIVSRSIYVIVDSNSQL